MIDNKHDNIDQDQFEFVQADSKIYDKKFETKPIGYFKDAMIRFGKNRTNVVATTILFTIILASIVLPIVSNKNVDELDAGYSNLPPRIPLLEDIGIADGTTYRDAKPVDLITVGTLEDYPGLGLPVNVDLEYIVEGTLTNYTEGCTLADETCLDGENVLRIKSTFDHVTILVPDAPWLTLDDNPYFSINVNEISGENAALNIYSQNELDEYVLLGTITEAGEYTFDPSSVIIDPSATFKSGYKIEFSTVDVADYAIFDLVEIGTDTEVIKSYSGFILSEFEYDTDDALSSGVFVRQNGVLHLAAYQFKDYEATFADSTINAYPKSKFDTTILVDFADVCEPNNPGEYNTSDYVGATFDDACPIKEVISRSSTVIGPNGEDLFSYTLIYNYAELQGYEEIPYFLFGTDNAGRDLFTLLFIATRTSLLLGFTVAGINISVGIVYGAISGYYGGWTDLILQRISEVIGRIPLLVTLSIMIALFGPGIQTLILILIVSGWIGVASVTRTQFYRYKGREYVLASRTLGAKDGRLIFRHILPNGIGTIITSSVLSIPYVIFTESTLSFLGFGIGHGQSFNVFGIEFSGVSVGVLLADGRSELLNRPYLTIFPAILISILMITFNMFGNALRDAFNPALRGSE